MHEGLSASTAKGWISALGPLATANLQAGPRQAHPVQHPVHTLSTHSKHFSGVPKSPCSVALGWGPLDPCRCHATNQTPAAWKIWKVGTPISSQGRNSLAFPTRLMVCSCGTTTFCWLSRHERRPCVSAMEQNTRWPNKHIARYVVCRAGLADTDLAIQYHTGTRKIYGAIARYGIARTPRPGEVAQGRYPWPTPPPAVSLSHAPPPSLELLDGSFAILGQPRLRIVVWRGVPKEPHRWTWPRCTVRYLVRCSTLGTPLSPSPKFGLLVSTARKSPH